MTGSNQPRFRVSGNEEAPNVVPFRRAEKPAPVPTEDKQGTVLDLIPVRLAPSRFGAPVTLSLLGPVLDVQRQIPVVSDILADAHRRSANGAEVTLSERQWALLVEMHERLAKVTADLSEGGFGMEWSATLNALLLLHLMENPNLEEVAKAKQVLEHMLNEMALFSHLEDRNGK